MAEYVRVPVSALIELPDSLSRDAGALIEPLAVGVHAVERVPAPVTENDTAVVIGAGPIGLVTALALRERGVERIFVTEPSDFRRDLAANCRSRRSIRSRKTLWKSYARGPTARVRIWCSRRLGHRRQPFK
jgi:threonine dehydrogenase-like Zn-dependent dehydrogenase